MTAHHIRRLDADLPAAVVSADRLRGSFRAALDRRLDAALARAGIDPSWVVAIRTLDVEIDADADDEAWAEAIAAALSALLVARPAGGWDASVAIFPSRVSAGLGLLRALAAGAPVPWWWPSLTGAATGSLSPSNAGEHVVSDWIAREPAAVPAAVVSLLRDGPAVLGLFAVGAGGRLLAALHASLSAARRALQPDPVAEPLSTEPDADATAAATLRLAARVALDITPRDAAALRLLPASEAPFFATCLVLANAPGIARPAAVAAALVELFRRTTQRQAHGRPPNPDPSTPTQLDALSTPQPLRPPTPPTPTPAGPTRAAAPAAVSHDSPPDSGEPIQRAPELLHPVGLGGLLFLLRWLARDPLLVGSSRDATPRLIAFVDAVLDRVLAPLEGSAQARVRREHRVLLSVFTGARYDVVHDSLADEVYAALLRLHGALPAKLDSLPASLAWTFGPIPDPLSILSPPDRALAALVLRPGQLRVEPHAADLFLSARLIDPTLRLGGWDIDPGWFPWVGRVIRFHYTEDP